MKIKSVSSFTCFAKDLNKTAEFYEKLGFDVKKRADDHIAVYLNWFSIQFILIEKEERSGYAQEAHANDRGAGILICLSVDNVDETYQELLLAGVNMMNEPHNTKYGNREFVFYDPDGYRLVIFKRK